MIRILSPTRTPRGLSMGTNTGGGGVGKKQMLGGVVVSSMMVSMILCSSVSLSVEDNVFLAWGS